MFSANRSSVTYPPTSSKSVRSSANEPGSFVPLGCGSYGIGSLRMHDAAVVGRPPVPRSASQSDPVSDGRRVAGQRSCKQFVVAVQKHQYPTRRRCGTRIAGRTHPLVPLTNQPDTGIGDCLDAPGRVVGRAVVDDDDLGLGALLAKRRRDRATHRCRSVERGDDDRDVGAHRASVPEHPGQVRDRASARPGPCAATDREATIQARRWAAPRLAGRTDESSLRGALDSLVQRNSQASGRNEPDHRHAGASLPADRLAECEDKNRERHELNQIEAVRELPAALSQGAG